MDFMRRHWFDVGILFACVVSAFLLIIRLQPLPLLLWISLVSLFVHQFEEYRYPGYFPGMVNTVMFNSKEPERYPLNANSALIINVLVGWLSYFLAALFATKALWLCMATILVSAGNFVAHAFVFNIKGKSRYNPGMVSAIALFGPIAVIFFYLVIRNNMASRGDWVLGIVLGIVLNYVGILKLIELLQNKNTRYVFRKRFMLPTARR
jgi:hypothetical protein